MSVAAPRHLCTLAAAFNLDVAEVRKQITGSIASEPSAADIGDRLETVVQLLAIEQAINAFLNSQDELGSSPIATKERP